ncbi:MAG: S1/P1 Nuclease [Flavobacteriales bacterium]|nr:MAG: S1/P1 Nuclease [Flavobacteriales bacterium]
MFGIISFLLFARPQTLSSWGFFAHKKINRLAVLTLPPGMIGFYKKNIEYVTEHAIDPDKRRYAMEGEAPRHYIDIDHYSEEDPFGVMPRKWNDAVEKFTEDTLMAYGIVPWHIDKMVWRLTKAFKEENFGLILKYSADLGHYVGDSYVPLHTTENYNGQMTGQRGIHGFWESRLPELFADEQYDFFVGRAKYIEYVLNHSWETVEASYAAKDSVLLFEAKLTEEYPSDRKYNYETRGTVTMKTYSREFSKLYHIHLNGMVERRMKGAVITTGSLWYTAWVNAGKPDLDKFSEKTIPEKLLKEISDDDEKFKTGKIKGRKHGN